MLTKTFVNQYNLLKAMCKRKKNDCTIVLSQIGLAVERTVKFNLLEMKLTWQNMCSPL